MRTQEDLKPCVPYPYTHWIVQHKDYKRGIRKTRDGIVEIYYSIMDSRVHGEQYYLNLTAIHAGKEHTRRITSSKKLTKMMMSIQAGKFIREVVKKYPMVKK